MIIDGYTHFTSKSYLKVLSPLAKALKPGGLSHASNFADRLPHMHNLEARLNHLDKYHIQAQVATLVAGLDPSLATFDSKDNLLLARRANDDLAKLSEKSRGRIHSLGVAPLHAFGVGGEEEVRRAIIDLGLKGIQVATNIHGKPIDAPEFHALFDLMAHFSLPIYIHPVDPVSYEGRKYEGEYDISHTLGWPYETGVALLRLIFTGILDKHPNLKLVTHHLGGVATFYGGRLDESYNIEGHSSSAPEKSYPKITKNVSEYLRMIYHDTAVGGSFHALRCGVDFYGYKHIIFATDYPYGPKSGEERLSKYPPLVRKLGLPENEVSRIFEANIRRLIKL